MRRPQTASPSRCVSSRGRSACPRARRLAGFYDGSLEWAPSPEETQAVFGGPSPVAPESQTGASIFTAIEEQLGLKLQDARAPIATVVITHAEPPAPN